MIKFINLFMKKKNIIPLYKTDLLSDEKKNIIRCLDENWISSKGSFIEKFQEDFKKKFKYKHAVVTTNGTTALHLALLALDIKKNDEVIVPNLTYVAPVNAVSYTGAKPILVDVDSGTWLINEKNIKKNINKKTKAIIVVHLYGLPCDMKKILKIGKKYNIKIIEDCAEAIGSKYNNIYVGNFGDISTFSFYGNKTITTGEGGMVVCKEKKVLNKVVMFKSQGININDKNSYNHKLIGYNYRMTNICAAIGTAQIKKIDNYIKKKIQIFKLYKKYLKDCAVEFQLDYKKVKNTYWLVTILLNDNRTKENLMKYLKKKNIETRPIFIPINQLNMYKQSDIKFSNSIKISNRGLSLPSFPGLSIGTIKYICDEIKKFMKNYN